MCLLQFMFDLSNVGRPMRGWLCVQLGTWHPYKQANCVLWSHWGPTIFGPLFHELIPNANSDALNFTPGLRGGVPAIFWTRSADP